MNIFFRIKDNIFLLCCCYVFAFRATIFRGWGVLLLLVWPQNLKTSVDRIFHVYQRTRSLLQSLKPEKLEQRICHWHGILRWCDTVVTWHDILDCRTLKWVFSKLEPGATSNCNCLFYHHGDCILQPTSWLLFPLDMIHLPFGPYCFLSGSDKMTAAMSDMTWAGTSPGTWRTVPSGTAFPVSKNLPHKKSWTSARASCQVRHAPKAREQVSFFLSTPNWLVKRWAQWSNPNLP